MKHSTFLFFLLIPLFSYSQTIHEVNVAVNQPEDCVVTAIFNTPSNIVLFPNPTTKSLTVSSILTIQQITIVDVAGRILYSEFVNGSDFNMDVSTYPKGVYHCILKHKSGTQNIKFILQ